MPMPTLNPLAEEEIVPASENHRRPTIVPPPVTASPEIASTEVVEMWSLRRRAELRI